jgi:hypothetical protein
MMRSRDGSKLGLDHLIRRPPRAKIVYDASMERNLEPADRTLRMTAGVFLILGGLLAAIPTYLQIIESWWYIVSVCLIILGVGAVLSACAAKCVLRNAIGH